MAIYPWAPIVLLRIIRHKNTSSETHNLKECPQIQAVPDNCRGHIFHTDINCGIHFCDEFLRKLRNKINKLVVDCLQFSWQKVRLCRVLLSFRSSSDRSLRFPPITASHSRKLIKRKSEIWIFRGWAEIKISLCQVREIWQFLSPYNQYKCSIV